MKESRARSLEEEFVEEVAGEIVAKSCWAGLGTKLFFSPGTIPFAEALATPPELVKGRRVSHVAKHKSVYFV